MLLIVPTVSGAQTPAPQPPTAEHRRIFLTLLEGPWAGQARVTPVGPRPYDMTFVRTAAMRLEGQAHPGASTHYWTFYEEANGLKLRFLSTFAGNQQPLWLTAVDERAETIVFRALQPDFLAVHVTPQATTLTLQIFLRGQPHVEIQLTRRGT